MEMEKHCLKTAVLFCIFLTQAVSEPVGVVVKTSISPIEETNMAPTEKTPFVVHAITTMPTPSVTQNPEGSFLTKLFERRTSAGPSLVVEVYDTRCKDASLKIMHLPLVRYQSNTTVISDAGVKSTEVDNKSTHHKSKRQVPVNPKELKFRIFDRRITQALVNAYATIDPYKASLMQANIHRLIIKVALDEEGEWLKHYGFALRDLPFVVPGGMPGAPIPRQRKRRSVRVAVLPTEEPVEVEPQEPVEPTEATESADIEPQEPIEVPTEPTAVKTKKIKNGKVKRAVNNESVEGEQQNPVEVDPREITAPEEVEPVQPHDTVEKTIKSKGKRVVKTSELEPQDPVIAEPTERFEVNPTETAEPAEAVEATEVEPQESVESGKKGKAKRAVKMEDKHKEAKVVVEDPEAADNPGSNVGNKRPVQVKYEKKNSKDIKEKAEQEQAELGGKKGKSMKKQKEEVEQEKEEKQKKNKKQKRQTVGAPPPAEIETVTTSSLQPTKPVLPDAVTPFNPYACDSICQQQATLQPICATNGFCIHEFPSQCSLKIYSCKHPQLGFQIKNHGACIYTANVPRCIDLLVAS